MADEAQVNILKQGIHPWNEWRHMNPAVRVYLSGADLCRAYIPVTDLVEAILPEQS